jgi:hypothetical protein
MWVILRSSYFTLGNDIGEKITDLVDDKNLEVFLNTEFCELVQLHFKEPTSLTIRKYSTRNPSKKYSNLLLKIQRDGQFVYALYAKWVDTWVNYDIWF